jgi:uncharacterized membrane protein
VGEVLANTQINNLTAAVVVPTINRRSAKVAKAAGPFSCTGTPFADTTAFSLNTAGKVAGYCVDAPSAPSKQFGFVRDKNGSHILLDFPGADGTGAFGINDNGKVTGQFYGPLRNDHGGALSYRFHCFVWDPVTNHYTQLDFPVPNTYVTCSAINKKGQILMEYITVTLSNEYLEHGWAVYDNGTFSILGLTFEHIGGPWIYFADMNNDGAAIGAKSQNDGTPQKLVFYDDGVFYDIAGMPPSWLLIDVGGMNNLNQFVGRYAVQTGVDPFHNNAPVYMLHGFVATPRPIGAAKRGGGAK